MYLVTACLSAFFLYTIGDIIYSVIVWKRAKDKRMPHPFVSNANYGRKKKKFGEYKVEQAIADIDLSINKTFDLDNHNEKINVEMVMQNDDDLKKENKASKKRILKKKNVEDNLAGEGIDIHG